MSLRNLGFFYSVLGTTFDSDFGWFYNSRPQLLSMEALEAQHINVTVINSFLLTPI
jgi:hypothetical protein